jgi:hypothetical protein
MSDINKNSNNEPTWNINFDNWAGPVNFYTID